MIEGLYATAKTLASEYDISESTVSRLKRLIIKNTPTRYAEDSVIYFGGATRIRRDVFHDAIRRRDLIVRGLAPDPDRQLQRTYFKEEQS